MADGTGQLSASRVAAATGISLGIIFVACWFGTMVAIPASHRFVELFTAFPMTSVAALAQGGASALVGGWIGGFLWSWLYNALPFGRT